MPEGPEIRRAADRVARVLEGRKVRRARMGLARLKPWERRLQGRVVQAVRTRGKAQLIHLAGGLTLYSHNQLYGRWETDVSGRPPRDGRSLRVELETVRGVARLYSASDIEVLLDDELEQHPYLRRLGPDVLDRSVTPADVERRLQDRAFTGRALGTLLLDQGFLGGVGNYLRSEILFEAGLSPDRRPVDLGPKERSRLARAALHVSRRAYRRRGVTAAPELFRRRRRSGESRQEARHFIFGRQGSPCPCCGETVTRIQAAGRRLYLCGACQH